MSATPADRIRMSLGLMLAYTVYAYPLHGGVIRNISRDTELHHPQILEEGVKKDLLVKSHEHLLRKTNK
jgi:hypothetical protein